MGGEEGVALEIKFAGTLMAMAWARGVPQFPFTHVCFTPIRKWKILDFPIATTLATGVGVKLAPPFYYGDGPHLVPASLCKIQDLLS